MLKFIVTIIALLVTAAAPALAQSEARSTAQRGVMRFDANKDGFVDKAEWQSAQLSRFAQRDADKDGKLSADEMARRPAGATGVLPADAQNTRRTPFFRRLDADRDGFVSKTEYMADADRRFGRCDTNKDGRINAEECRQALRR
ncbi:MAG TPA: hypothetical protein VEC14_06440 [Reyranellaceae bacterium]|nr:hypothetical protein [Reyranellaceae bacterium]